MKDKISKIITGLFVAAAVIGIVTFGAAFGYLLSKHPLPTIILVIGFLFITQNKKT